MGDFQKEPHGLSARATVLGLRRTHSHPGRAIHLRPRGGALPLDLVLRRDPDRNFRHHPWNLAIRLPEHAILELERTLFRTRSTRRSRGGGNQPLPYELLQPQVLPLK